MLEQSAVLPQVISARAAAEPDAVLVQVVDGPSHTVRAVDEQARRWARMLQEIGVTAHTPVATMLPNTPDAYLVWLGAAWLRAIEVPVNNAFRGQMLRYVINNCRSEVRVTSTAFLPRVLEVADSLEHVTTVAVTDGDEELGGSASRFELLLAQAMLPGPAFEGAGPAAYDIAAMIHTSGTTGPSKGVLVPWGLCTSGREPLMMPCRRLPRPSRCTPSSLPSTCLGRLRSTLRRWAASGSCFAAASACRRSGQTSDATNAPPRPCRRPWRAR